MKIGLQIPSFDWPGGPAIIGSTLREIARTADQGGFASLWLMDHFFGIGSVWGEPDAPMLEGYTAIAYMAALTQRISVGLMVTGAIYRHPGVLIKTVSTLDVLTGGRAYFGIGAGWYEREARGLGLPYPPTRERLGRLEETLAIAHHMWRGNTSAFNGQFYQLDEPLNVPQPLAQPHPPILIGGEGERQTLRLVAQYGDACNFQLGAPLPGYPQWYIDAYHQRAERLPHKLACLREHCRAAGRSYESIERTVLGSVQLGTGAMSITELVEVCHELAEMGFQHVIYNLPDVHTITPIVRLAEELIPQVWAL